MDDCKRREETGDKPLRRVSSTGLRHGSPESKVPTKPGVSKVWARWGPLGTGHTESIQSRQQDAHEGRHGDFDGGGRSSGAAFDPPLYAATAHWRPHVENHYSFFNCVNRQLCMT